MDYGTIIDSIANSVERRGVRRPPAAAAMPSVSFKFCTAKVAGEGEDADPILRVGPGPGPARGVRWHGRSRRESL